MNKFTSLRLVLGIILSFFLFVSPFPINAETPVYTADMVYAETLYTNDNGGQNTSVCVRDFNNDGILDFASTKHSGDVAGDSNRVTIHLGNGDGTFTSFTSITVGTSPLWINSEDINKDGIFDLLVSCSWSYGIDVLIGNGDGTFGSPTLYTVDGFPGSIVIADFNHDTNLDFAVPSSSQSICVFMGDGMGSFQASQQTYPCGYHPQTMTKADFNKDGNQDLAVTNVYSGCITVLLGNANGSFQTMVQYATGAHPCNLVTGDVNNDGFSDILTANEDSDNVSILLGKGDGSFNSAYSYPAGRGAHDIILKDINADNIEDVVVSNCYGDNLTTLLGNGDGTFTSISNNLDGMYFPVFIGSGDFNSDGKLDFVVATYDSMNVFLLQTMPYSRYTNPISSYPDTGGYRGWLQDVPNGKKVMYHVGIDYKADVGTRVVSILGNGEVVYANQLANGFGALNPSKKGGAVVIRYQNNEGSNFYVLYGHITIDQKVFNALNSKGQILINKNQEIGKIAPFSNGGITCPHLHLGISTTLDLKLMLGGYIDKLVSVGSMVNPYDYLETHCK